MAKKQKSKTEDKLIAKIVDVKMKQQAHMALVFVEFTEGSNVIRKAFKIDYSDKVDFAKFKEIMFQTYQKEKAIQENSKPLFDHLNKEIIF